MLPRSKRISTKQFVGAIKEGEVLHTPFFMVRCAKSDTTSRFGVSVSKKIAKTAVLRNLIKRRVYSAVKELSPLPSPAKKIIFIMKSGSDKAVYAELKEEVQKIVF